LDKAIEAMQKALEIVPNDYEIHFGLAEYYGETEDTVSALKYYASGVDWFMDEEIDDDYLEAVAIVKSGKIISD